MVEQQVYSDSNYRFSDPIRYFKANDPYYFEVDNIPLKQLQENCLWLKDQIRRDAKSVLSVKRGDLDELRPFATGGDRILRVKPGRYTARINDATSKAPLAYLEKVMGDALGDVDAWKTALPNPGNFANNKNAVLQSAVESFQQSVALDAKGMTGLAERAFTWPIVDVNKPIDNDGVDLISDGRLRYGDWDYNSPGGGAHKSPMVISQALVWARAKNNEIGEVALPSFETTNTSNGWAKFPRTESFFVKRWRGISRLAIVDVDTELGIEVPQFDPMDFAYFDANGTETAVAGVESRIDLVFIYSKSVDSSGTTILKPSGKETITRPTLGIVRGAGIKTNFQESIDITKQRILDLNDDHGIAAHPGDQKNTLMGFTSTSGNDIAEDIRGSFPAPDDILNLAPLISEKLEDEAYELVGQSILPVAYVWVQNGSQIVASTDVIDIRPMFRTAELTYNERAGLGAAMPQLSLANPAVGKSQMDYELKKIYNDLQGKIANVQESTNPVANTNILATGYVFGGWNFGPEGALFSFYQNVFAEDPSVTVEDTEAYLRQYVTSKYGIGSAGSKINIPTYPDWDLSQWCVEQDIDSKGLYPNDYINTFVSNLQAGSDADPSITAGSVDSLINPDGTNAEGGVPTRLNNFNNIDGTVKPSDSKVNFHYVQKRIKFNRPAWMADYKVDVELINCLSQNTRGSSTAKPSPGDYQGVWVEKGFDEFIIYVAFTADQNSGFGGTQTARFPSPHSLTFKSGGKKKKSTKTLTVSERGGGRFSSFLVPVGDLLYSNTAELAGGYVGNPRVGKCTYPTVMWSVIGTPLSDSAYLYGNLNGTNPTITLKGG